ncbi:hypothetical protein [Deinococcus sp. PEB2-67]
MARVNPAGLASLRVRLTAVALRGAEAAADVARDKLSGPGSGRQHARLPNRSSAEGEYPAEQSSRLRDSIDAEGAGSLRARWGALRNVPGYVMALHFKPPDMGGRPFMDDLLQDRDVHRAVRTAMGVKP